MHNTLHILTSLKRNLIYILLQTKLVRSGKYPDTHKEGNASTAFLFSIPDVASVSLLCYCLIFKKLRSYNTHDGPVCFSFDGLLKAL